ncbi:MAG: hypothetical protein BMS9Abin13_434 [Patescibacteria group bacterium]|nr:MAG: hypothetical protein BMS9Abin13_434 [Patescibacteria group bacterium]
MHNFSFGEKEKNKLSDWLKEHNKTCSFADIGNQGAIGGRISYIFTPTGIGCVVEVKCACGEKVDITDYGDW